MRKTRISLALLLALFAAEARAGEQINLARSDAPIKEVTVYTSQALVKRLALFEAKEAGDAKVVLARLPQAIQGESVRIRSELGTTLLGTRVVPRPVAGSSQPAVRGLEAELRDNEERQRAIGDAMAVHSATLQQIEALRGAQAGDEGRWREAKAQDLAALVTWAEAAQTTSLAAKRALTKELEELVKQRRITQAKLDALSRDRGIEQDVEVDLRIAKPGKYRLEVEYVTGGASWRPRYDLRADAEAKTIEATYQGLVTQRTGEDWEGVALALSTARPEIGARPPELAQATVGVNTAELEVARAAPVTRANAAGVPKIVAGSLAEKYEDVVAVARVEARGATVAFNVTTPETIPSDGKEKRTTIGKSSWKTENRYVTVPKLSPFAYLQSKVTNAFAYPLLPGEASVYFGQDYVGKSRVDLVPAGEKLEVYLGVDERVRVERKTEKRFRDTRGVFTTDVRERYEYRIPIKNSRAEAIKITVIDQVPVSVTEEIRVEDVAWAPEVVQPGEDRKPVKGGKDDPTGERRWELVVPAKGEAAVTLGYTVRFPLRMEGTVAGLER